MAPRKILKIRRLLSYIARQAQEEEQSMFAATLPALATPGLLLGPASNYAPGPGTHTYNGGIFASISGRPRLIPAPPSHPNKPAASSSTTKESSLQKAILTIPRLPPSPTHATIPSAQIARSTTLLPQVGHVVLARVVRVRVRQVDVVILCIQNPDVTTGQDEKGGEERVVGRGAIAGEWIVCKDEWPAVVRREDVRATEKDKVVLSEGFRVGDVIRGGVVSLSAYDSSQSLLESSFSAIIVGLLFFVSSFSLWLHPFPNMVQFCQAWAQLFFGLL